ncbi:MAG: hypothetical protein KBS59_00225 [Clostridiales bacterium]|nr:hypothetical protein [Clostridiales bacterium]
MDCLKRYKENTRASRKQNDMLDKSLEMVLASVALELVQKKGWGAAEVAELCNGAMERVVEYSDKYDYEFAITALQMHLKDEAGFKIQVREK